MTTGDSPLLIFGPILERAVEDGLLDPLDDNDKQFVGSVVCTIMLANSCRRTYRKQRFSRGLFSSGERYELVSSLNIIESSES